MDSPSTTTARPRLYANCITELDWLIALEFGRVDEGQDPTAWRAVSEQFGYLSHDGRCVGFKVLGFSAFDLDAPEHEAIWRAPLFDAPTLALEAVPAGEVILAARTQFAGRPSLNRLYFQEAIAAEDRQDELDEWIACVQSGDSMAHYGLGIALFDHGQVRRAYTHLRFYASIAPFEPWAQYWYAKAALAVEEYGEAMQAASRAAELGPDENLDQMIGSLRAAIRESS